jgi:predicted GNAT family N-acyltransferase
MEFEVVEELTYEQVRCLHQLYQKEWWTKGRKWSEVQRMVENSDITIGLCNPQTRELVAFTRVLTDYVYKALILDVIVKESYRGKKLGRILMDSVLHHPLLKDVMHFELYCRPEMIPFYQKWGFTEELGELYFMRKTR